MRELGNGGGWCAVGGGDSLPTALRGSKLRLRQVVLRVRAVLEVALQKRGLTVNGRACHVTADAGDCMGIEDWPAFGVYFSFKSEEGMGRGHRNSNLNGTNEKAQPAHDVLMWANLTKFKRNSGVRAAPFSVGPHSTDSLGFEH